MRPAERMVEVCDKLCAKLVDKELWDLSKDAENLKSLLVKHADNLAKFIELVEKLDAEAL